MRAVLEPSDTTTLTSTAPSVAAALAASRVSAALYGASKMPGMPPRPSIRRHESPRSSGLSGLPLPLGSCTRASAMMGTSRLATPCMLKTMETVRPRDVEEPADSLAIVADSG